MEFQLNPDPEDGKPSSLSLEAIAKSRDLGAAEAELADLRLRVKENEEREQRLIEQIFSAQERLGDALATEAELRIQLGRYAQFYEAVQRSRAWRVIQYIRRLVGREW